MTLTPGARLGVYEIVTLVGSGGMGEVYRARDPRLGREVAVKVLPPAFATDDERLRRFEQEARAAAALNHPNILGIFDIGTHDRTPYVVAELLEGATLRERLRSGALPVRKAIDVAVQMARALSAAHDKGIVHRDLKPENVFVMEDGRVKILDFGLAKLVEREAAVSSGTGMATIPPDTLAGVVLGTVGYMAPEQVRGRTVDHRTDIFALGAVLYEMLSGRRAFHGETTPDTMTAILTEDPPDLPSAERHISPALARIVHRCLEKSPAARFQSAGDLAFALDGSSEASSGVEAIRVQKPSRRREFAWTTAAAGFVLSALGIAAVMGLFNRVAPDPVGYQSSIVLPPGLRPSTGLPAYGRFAVSPDGRRLAVVVIDSAGRQLVWVRPLDSLTGQTLTGTDGASYPFWSADSRSVGFIAQGKLKRIDATGGSPPIAIADALFPSPGVWTADDTIVFNAKLGAGLFRIPAGGGTPVETSTVDRSRGEQGHGLPSLLPDGRHFFFSGGTATSGLGVFVGSLDPKEKRVQVLSTSSNAKFSQGHVLFMRESTLMAQEFDAKALRLRGEPMPIAEQIETGALANSSFGAFSVSSTGVLLLQRGTKSAGSQLVWVDRDGRQAGTIGEPGSFGNLELSPDRKHAVVASRDRVGQSSDLWVVDLERGLRTRLTFGEGGKEHAVWSPDGARVVFDATRGETFGPTDLYTRASNGIGDDELLLKDDRTKMPSSWSPDGRFLMFATSPPAVSLFNFDLWVLPMSGDRKPVPFLQTPFNEYDGHFSPDGKWVAYVSDESGRFEIYVLPFMGNGGKTQISTAGGFLPRWRDDGKELYYVNRDQRLVAVSVTATANGLDVGASRQLFQMPNTIVSRSNYDVTADGQRILLNAYTVDSAVVPPLTMIVNWTAALRRSP